VTWYDVLKAVRRISKGGAEITSTGLAAETGIPLKVASAWLSNFYHWGYVLPIGRKNGRGRPTNLYQITNWGERFRPSKELRVPAPLKKVANPPKEKP
jgi:predicted ArsR family transcriptional regulator